MADSTSPPPPKAKTDDDWEGYENDFRGRVLVEVVRCAVSPPTDVSVLQDRLNAYHELKELGLPERLHQPQLEKIDMRPTSEMVMEGIPASKCVSVWDETDKRVAANWRELQVTPELRDYFGRLEGLVARDAQLQVSEVAIECILEGRAKATAPEQEPVG